MDMLTGANYVTVNILFILIFGLRKVEKNIDKCRGLVLGGGV